MSVYLDCNATTPLAVEVLEVTTAALRDAWANPNSSHEAGEARDQLSMQRWFVDDVTTSVLGGGHTSHARVYNIIEGSLRDCCFLRRPASSQVY